MKKLLLLLFAVMAIGSLSAAEKLAYTLEFKTGTNNNSSTTDITKVFTSESQKYVASIATSSTSIYGTANGYQLASGKKNGSLTINLAQPVNANTVIVYASKFNSSDKTASPITFSDNSTTVATGTISPTTEKTAYTKCPFSVNGQFNRIEISAESGKRLCIQKIEVYVDSEPVMPLTPVATLSDGTEFSSDMTVEEGTTLTLNSTNATSLNITDNGVATTGVSNPYTLTPAVGSHSFSVTGENSDGTSEALAFNITVTEKAVNPATPVVTFSGITAETDNTYEVKEGTEVTIASAYATQIEITEGATTTYADGNSTVITITKAATYIFTGKNKFGSSDSFQVSFTIKEPGNYTYNVVTSQEAIAAGARFVIGSSLSNFVMNSKPSTNGLGATPATITDGVLEVNEDDITDDALIPLEFTLVTADADGFYLMNDEGKYLNQTGKNSMSWGELDDTRSYVTITYHSETWKEVENGMEIVFSKVTTDKGTLQFFGQGAGYSTGARFNAFASNQKGIQLYTKAELTIDAPVLFIEGEQVGNIEELTLADVEGKILNFRQLQGHNVMYQVHVDGVPTTGANKVAPSKPVTEAWVDAKAPEYNHQLPEKIENSLTIYTKAVKGNKESEHTGIHITNEGTVTGVENIATDEAQAPVEWFNLQGVKVENPGAGLYIRRQGSKVSKVVVK